jgi:hypothetical protein
MYDTTGSASLGEGCQNLCENKPISYQGAFKLGETSAVELQMIGTSASNNIGMGNRHNTEANGNNIYTCISILQIA